MKRWVAHEFVIESAPVLAGAGCALIRLFLPVPPGVTVAEDILVRPFRLCHVEERGENGVFRVIGHSVGAHWFGPGEHTAGTPLALGEAIAVWIQNVSDAPRVFRGALVGLEEVEED